MREAYRKGRPIRSLERVFLLLAFFAVVVTFGLHKTVTKHDSASSSSWFYPGLGAIRRKETRLYVPSPAEHTLMQNLGALGYNTGNDANASGCDIWYLENNTTANASLVKLSKDLNAFRRELATYARVVREFAGVSGDLRQNLTDHDVAHNHEVCRQLDLHPNGLLGIFPSGQLSSFQSGSGFVEPLFPPMRHPETCFPRDNYAQEEILHLMSPEYLVHDFAAMCRQLKPTSRIVFVDMGASLGFHDNKPIEDESYRQPALWLINLFRKFGFYFDHIYAYELQPTPPDEVFARLPPHLMPAYHWINVGINTTPGHELNPFTSLLSTFNEDDLILVKLDIDTPKLEMQLALQLLEQEDTTTQTTTTESNGSRPSESQDGKTSLSNSTGPRLRRLVDQFYFEHHVHLAELAQLWGEETMEGSVKDSMKLFLKLRKLGVPAHFWV